jgi:hypothetical protein
VWRLKPPHKIKVNVKGGGVDGFDVDLAVIIRTVFLNGNVENAVFCLKLLAAIGAPNLSFI